MNTMLRAHFVGSLVALEGPIRCVAVISLFLVSATLFRIESQAASPKRSRAVLTNRLMPAQRPSRRGRPLRKPDVIYYSTPPETVTEMLRMAGIKKGDVLYDLGSGDGRIPIAAAQQYGVRAVGIEIDPKLISEAEENARRANVSSLVSFRNDDMFRTDLREATVVTLYLSEKLNVLLRPKLLRELRPGTRIVSHDFRMGDWKPEQSVRVPWGKLYRTVYLWTVPERRGVARIHRALHKK
jgi:hypothetical protein